MLKILVDKLNMKHISCWGTMFKPKRLVPAEAISVHCLIHIFDVSSCTFSKPTILPFLLRGHVCIELGLVDLMTELELAQDTQCR